MVFSHGTRRCGARPQVKAGSITLAFIMKGALSRGCQAFVKKSRKHFHGSADAAARPDAPRKINEQLHNAGTPVELRKIATHGATCTDSAILAWSSRALKPWLRR